jgi:hypothetical protein
MPGSTSFTLVSERARGERARRWALLVAALGLAVELAALRRRGYRFGGRVLARCRAGHEFTTWWLPGVSLKALRLGPWRVQRCPVGRHWSLIALVDRARLDGAEAPVRGDRAP